MINPPKEISNANIPKKIIMTSYAVMCATSLPMYSGIPVVIGSGGYHPVMGTFIGDCIIHSYAFQQNFFEPMNSTFNLLNIIITSQGI